jgi:hypothetical protein
MKWVIAKNKLGDYLLDVSKLILAGVVLNVVYNSVSDFLWETIIIGLIAVVIISFVGFILSSKN